MGSAFSAQDELGWIHRGACRDLDPELFFPIARAGPAQSQVLAAKAVCGHCSVQEACLHYALDTCQDHGVWGGTSEEERRAMRRARREQAVRRASRDGAARLAGLSLRSPAPAARDPASR